VTLGAAVLGIGDKPSPPAIMFGVLLDEVALVHEAIKEGSGVLENRDWSQGPRGKNIAMLEINSYRA